MRRIFYFPSDLIRKRESLSPPKGLIFTGSGDFIKQGDEWLRLLQYHTSLDKNSNVLDIGSGIGRIAIPLTRVLQGEYHGIEPVKKGI